MKKIVAVIIFQALAGIIIAQSKTQPLSINQKDVIGVWEGYYEQAGVNKSLTMEFRQVNGQLECYIDMPDRGIKNAKFTISVCEALDYHIERTSTDKTAFLDNTHFMFVGKPDGDKMTGKYKIGSSCSPGAAPSFSVTKTAGL